MDFLICSFLDLCGSVTPRCGGSLLRLGQLFSLKHFLSFLSNHLSAWCDILKVSHAHRNSVVRYQKSIAHLWEKYRSTSESVTLLLRKCLMILFSVALKYHTGVVKNLRESAARTFWFDPNFLRVDLDILFDVLEPYGVAFWIWVVFVLFQFCIFHCCPSGFKIYCLRISWHIFNSLYLRYILIYATNHLRYVSDLYKLR